MPRPVRRHRRARHRARRGGDEPVEDGERVERARRALGVVLDGLDRQLAVAQALDRAVVEVDLARPGTRDDAGQRRRRRPAPRGSAPSPGRAPSRGPGPGGWRRGGRTAGGVVSAPAARATIWWPRQIPSSGRPSSMTARASATGRVEPRRVAGAGRQDDARRRRTASSVGRRSPCAGRTRTRAPRRRSERTMFALSPKSTIAIRGPRVAGRLDVGHGRRRDLADEVLVLPARDGRAAARRPRPRSVVAGRGDDAAQAAVRAEVAGQRARVHARDRRDRVVAQQRGELAGVVEDRGRRVGDDQRPEPRADRLVVLGEPAVVADQRVGHDDDLAGVRGVGADLLVARLAGVDDEVAAGRDGAPNAMPGKTVPSSSASNAGPRSPMRGSTMALARGRGGTITDRSPGPGYDEPTGRRGLGGRGRTRSMDLLRRPHGTDTPASQDRP